MHQGLSGILTLVSVTDVPEWPDGMYDDDDRHMLGLCRRKQQKKGRTSAYDVRSSQGFHVVRLVGWRNVMFTCATTLVLVTKASERVELVHEDDGLNPHPLERVWYDVEKTFFPLLFL